MKRKQRRVKQGLERSRALDYARMLAQFRDKTDEQKREYIKKIAKGEVYNR